MTQPINQRFNYHPDPRHSIKSDRKVLSRLAFISSKVDFQDKIVLDLGCSGGFFSFELSKVAKKVIAIDGDEEIIARNKSLQRELGIRNIEFIHSNINRDILSSVGKVDVTLFLSVFHHMLTSSDAYDWNNGLKFDEIKAMLEVLNKITSILIFEMGETNEGYEWCERMPKECQNNHEFIVTNIFKNDYKIIDYFQRHENINFFNSLFIAKLSSSFKIDSKLVSMIKRLCRFDSRDFRKIYIGKK